MGKIAVDDTSRESAVGLIFVGLGPVMLVCSLVTLWFAHLRENHDFWIWTGGYPAAMREIVKFGYYPLLLLTIFTLFGLTVTLVAKIKKNFTFLFFQTLLLLICWALIVESLVVSFADDL